MLRSTKNSHFSSPCISSGEGESTCSHGTGVNGRSASRTPFLRRAIAYCLCLLIALNFTPAAFALTLSNEMQEAIQLYAQKRFDDVLKIAMPLAQSGDHLAEDLIADYWRYERHKGTEAEFHQHEKRALEGNSLEQFIVGTMYETGFFVERSDADAFKWYRKAAEQGRVVAMRYLGWMFEQGLGIEKNEKEAFKCYEKAALAHEPRSIFKLGLFYENGTAVKKDSAKSIECYKTAFEDFSYLAGLGSSFDQYRLGYMYQFGNGVTKNSAEASKWYLKAAEQGDTSSMNNIAWMYLMGDGLPREPAKSLEWYKKMAALGSAEGFFNIGLMYESGLGVKKDDDEAINYFKKAGDIFKEQLEDMDRKSSIDALYRIGLIYKNRRDIIEAGKWFSKAAALGHYDSRQELQNMPDYP